MGKCCRYNECSKRTSEKSPVKFFKAAVCKQGTFGKQNGIHQTAIALHHQISIALHQLSLQREASAKQLQGAELRVWPTTTRKSSFTAIPQATLRSHETTENHDSHTRQNHMSPKPDKTILLSYQTKPYVSHTRQKHASHTRQKCISHFYKRHSKHYEAFYFIRQASISAIVLLYHLRYQISPPLDSTRRMQHRLPAARSPASFHST